MQPIDYSKWDHIDYSSDENTDDNNSNDDFVDSSYEETTHNNVQKSRVTKSVKHHPNVTKLEYPSKVIIGPDGVHMERMPEVATSSPFRMKYTETHYISTNQTLNEESFTKEHQKREKEEERQYSLEEYEEHEQEEEEQRTEQQKQASSEKEEKLQEENQLNLEERVKNIQANKVSEVSVQLDDQSEQRNDDICESISSSIDVEDDVLYNNLIKNGGREGESHLWSQTADTVTVSFIVPFTTKSKNVTCFRITDNYSTETYETKSTIDFRLETREGANQKFSTEEYHNTFRYPVKTDEDLIDGCWQLQTIPSRNMRLLVVQVFKREVGVGMTLWWDKCFEEDKLSVIDPCQIEERKRRGNNNSSNAFQETWQKAHEEFKKRMKERKHKQV